MDYLTLAQTLRRECRIPGTGPTTVTDQTGEALDLVTWVNDAWRSIQQEHSGNWRWLRRPWSFETVSGTATYAYTDITDSDTALDIDRPGRWLLDGDYAHCPTRYLTSAGASTKQRMMCSDIRSIRSRYDIGTHSDAVPQFITEDDQGRIVVKPTPDDAYTISGWYMRGPQVLAEDEDEPEMPAQYHNLIVWVAMMDYGYNDVAQELLQRAQMRAPDLWDALVMRELIQSMGAGAPPLV